MQTPIAWSADLEIDGVILPQDTKPMVSQRKFSGTWFGAWGGTLKHILVIENIDLNGNGQVIYAVGDALEWGIKRNWQRLPAKLAGDKLTVFGRGFEATYKTTESGKFSALFAFGKGRSQAIMKRADIELLKSEQSLRWTDSTSEMVQTNLVEHGKSIELEIVVFVPKDKGPFPLAVINHGSTGTGTNQNLFKHTWIDTGLADYLTNRGYLVAFPQRRGRGRSDGLYDEGFSGDRKKGYSCQSRRSLAGSDRALEDLHAAITQLKKRSDVSKAPILIGGVSRGGILSTAYAGQNGVDVSGVLNFVGGWMGEACENGNEINTTLFEMGAAFQKPTLWLYGRNDPFYSIKHSRKNFKAFEKSGGKGRFIELEVPGGNGHNVNVVQDIWFGELNTYLDTVVHTDPK